MQFSMLLRPEAKYFYPERLLITLVRYKVEKYWKNKNYK